MGQKINPVGMRLGINRTWDSRWYATKAEYGDLLLEDFKIREHILKYRRQAGISKVVIERPHKKCRVTVHSARPGILIGKKGSDIEKLKGALKKYTDSEVHLNIVEVRKPEIDANLVAEGIAQQLERRVAFRRAMKRSVQSAMRLGAEGIRINCAGRLGGAEIAHWNGIVRAVCHYILFALISTMVQLKALLLTVSLVLKFGSLRARSWNMIRWLKSAFLLKLKKVAVLEIMDQNLVQSAKRIKGTRLCCNQNGQNSAKLIRVRLRASQKVALL